MSKLLRANFARLLKSRLFWLGTFFMAALGTYFPIQNYNIMQKEERTISPDGAFFMFALIIPLILSVFCGFFIGTEYSDGTMRNKFIVGGRRITVYMANFLICTAAAFIISAAYAVPYLICGIPLLGTFNADISHIIVIMLCVLAVTEVFTAIFTLIATLIPNKANGAVSCILMGLALFISGIYGGLYIRSSLAADNLSETKREICEFLYDFLPGCQLIQLCNMNAVHPLRMFLYSVFIASAATVIGILTFRKKDLK
ncbi:MAG: ABC transporter permease [Oscillospiraceae bacterium]|nr:ABC transporter permease [Oscillospiraceae bacterium]MDE6133862.1 ABC transporter permease [Oscillospiraceae bacterium]